MLVYKANYRIFILVYQLKLKMYKYINALGTWFGLHYLISLYGVFKIGLKFLCD